MVQHRTLRACPACVGQNVCCVAYTLSAYVLPSISKWTMDLLTCKHFTMAFLHIHSSSSSSYLIRCCITSQVKKGLLNKLRINHQSYDRGLVQQEHHIRKEWGKSPLGSPNMYIKYSGNETISFKWTQMTTLYSLTWWRKQSQLPKRRVLKVFKIFSN
jgi:hypothetical protein